MVEISFSIITLSFFLVSFIITGRFIFSLLLSFFNYCQLVLIFISFISAHRLFIMLFPKIFIIIPNNKAILNIKVFFILCLTFFFISFPFNWKSSTQFHYIPFYRFFVYFFSFSLFLQPFIPSLFIIDFYKFIFFDKSSVSFIDFY